MLQVNSSQGPVLESGPGVGDKIGGWVGVSKGTGVVVGLREGVVVWVVLSVKLRDLTGLAV